MSAPTRPRVDRLLSHLRGRISADDPRHEREIAAEFVDRLTGEEVRELAIRSVASDVWSRRRSVVRATETAAVRRGRRPVREHVTRQPETGDFERLLADPRLMYYGGRLPDHPTIRLAPFNLRKFRDWAGDRFDEWHERARAVADSVDMAQDFADDWHPRGPQEAARERWAGWVRDQAEQMARTQQLRLTRELLGSEFALGDGRRVTWGDATLAEHEQRADLLIGNASANAETATRHLAAVVMLRDRRVSTLADLADEPAAAAS